MSGAQSAGAIRRRRLVAIGTFMLALAVIAWIVFGLLLSADTAGAEVSGIAVDSKDVGSTLETNVVIPEGVDADGAPLLVFLHGRGGDEDAYTGDDAMFAALAGTEGAPVVAFPDGGDSSYWHDRDAGKWGSYVTCLLYTSDAADE